MKKTSARAPDAPPARPRHPAIPAPCLHAALDLLQAVESDARPADAVTAAFFRGPHLFEEHDQGTILDLLQALLRHRARLGWWLDRQGHADTPRGRLLAWLALVQGRSPEHVSRLFVVAESGPLTDAEHGLLTGLQGAAIDHPDMPQQVRLECPPWAFAPLLRRFGSHLDAEMAATLTPPPLDLRVNPITSTRRAVVRELAILGLQPQALTRTPSGVRLPSRLSLALLPGLKTGQIEIQDEGSQLVARLVDAQPGDRVVDFCAGAGGKTLAIGAQMLNRGRIVACDINPVRLGRCAERVRRAGLHNVETRVLSSESDRWVKRHKAGFDRVLIDAPCSGTGTWRRNPDARWRAPDLGLDNLLALQARILASAARLTRPGGRLVYATCSLLPEENEDQVAAFLAAHPGFHVVPLTTAAPDLLDSAHPDYLSLTPARHGTDGFFAAILQRAAT